MLALLMLLQLELAPPAGARALVVVEVLCLTLSTATAGIAVESMWGARTKQGHGGGQRYILNYPRRIFRSFWIA